MRTSTEERTTKESVVESAEVAYGGNELLLRFFESEWFTPAVSLRRRVRLTLDLCILFSALL